MKVVFVGSSLFGSNIATSGLEVRPPAKHGDIFAAIRDGAIAIGLVDGAFGEVAAIRHKEILFALDQGVAVFGASSMGALRAAECEPFGMRPVGAIAAAYCDGSLDDDAALALTMGPAELGSIPCTEPLVDAEATLARMRSLGLIDAALHSALRERARSLHFSVRTDAMLFERLGDGPQLLEQYRRHHVSQKQLDAEALVRELQAFHPAARRAADRFVLADSPYWRDELEFARR
jgi:hypothetical protein